MIRVRFLLASFVVVLAWQTASTQSLSYLRGQNVSPAFEGWEKNEDGSFNMMFGYMNRNWEEEVDVPVGPDNNISPGAPDQGQPTHFLPRRNRFVFKVRVPADWGKKELIWTLTTKGKTERAYASLREDSLRVLAQRRVGALGLALGGERPDQFLLAPVRGHAHLEHESIAARQEMCRLPLIRRAGRNVVVRPDGHVHFFLPVAVHVAEHHVERAVLVLLPAFKGRRDVLAA